MIKIKEQEIRSMAEDFASELKKSGIGLTDDEIAKLKEIAYKSLVKSYEIPIQIFEIEKE